LSLDIAGTGEYSPLSLDELKKVKWNFPENRTMLVKGIPSMEGLPPIDISTGKLCYKIYSQLVSNYVNNTISCSYVLNGTTYSTEKVFNFGYSGTMGTKQTIVIGFEGDTNAFVTNNPVEQEYTLRLNYYDEDGAYEEIN
jgi:hypothetical protein